MKFLVDREINLAEKDSKVDLLHTKGYADILLQSVKNAPQGDAYTIGLFGEWGCGKSSVIRTMTDAIAANPQMKNVKVVNYDAWKYSGDSFRRMFLLQLQQGLGYERSELMNSFYLNSSEDAHINTKIDYKLLCIGFAIVTAVCVVIAKLDCLSTEFKIAANAVVALGSLLFTIIKGFLKELKVNINHPHMFAPEQFEECYMEMCKKAFAKEDMPLSYLRYITDCGKGSKSLDQLVIVIDNIDRCQPEVSYTLLTDIKNFLCKDFNVVFVIPVDVDALRKHIVKHSSEDHYIEADEFLRKFFNTSIWMKPYQNDEMFDFANGIAQRNALGFKPDTIALVANEFATNPRRIIQLFNNLQVELSGYDAAFAQEHQALITKLLIIKEEFPIFYRSLVRDPKLFFKDPLALKMCKPENLDTIEQIIANDARLSTFLIASAGISSRYYERRDIVLEILVNSQIGNSLSQELHQAYRSVNIDVLEAAVQEDNVRMRLVDYLQDNIRKSVRRSTLNSDGFLHLRVLLALFSKGLLTDDDKLRLMQPLDSSSTLDTFVKLFKDKEQIILFGKDIERLQLPNLSATLVNYFKDMDDVTEEFSTDDTRNLFFAASVWNIDQCKKIANKFAQALEKDPVTCRSYKYEEEKNTILFTKEVFDFIFKNLKAGDCMEEESAFQTFVYLCSIKAVTNEKLLAFIDKAKEIAPSFDHAKPDDSTVANFLDVLSKVFNNLRHLGCVVPLTAMQQLFDKVNHSHQMTNSNGYRQTTVTHSFVRDKADDERCANIVNEFFANANFVTIGSVVSNAEIEKFVTIERNRENILNTLSYMNSNGIDISTWTNAIITMPERNEVRRVNLLRSAFTQKNIDGQYEVDDNTVKNELTAMIAAVLNPNESSDNIEDMLDHILSDKRIDSFTREILTQKSLDELRQLPEMLMKKAISSFEANVDNLSIPGDLNVFRLLASLGSDDGRSCVWEKVNPVLADGSKQNVTNINAAVEVLLSFSALTKEQNDALAANISALPSNKLSESKRKECINFLSKLKER